MMAKSAGWSRRQQTMGVVIVGLLVVYIAGAVTIYPSIFPDPSYGLLVQKSMRAGAPWNHMTEPHADDLASDDTYFYTTWSPGQHVVPGLLMNAGLSPGDAVRLVNVSAALVGLAGWYGLLGALGFGRTTVLATCLLIAASRTFTFSFLTYVGSDQLAFAGFPYLARLVLACRRGVWVVAAAPAAVLAGFFLKNSMAIYLGAWTAAVVAVTWAPRARTVKAWALAAAVAGSTLAAFAVIDWAYVSRGWTPVAYQPAWSGDPSVYLLPSAMTLLAGTGVDDLLSRAFDHPAGPRVDYKGSFPFLLLVVAGVAMWAGRELRRADGADVRRLVFGFAAVVAAAFTVLFATGSGASLYLSRHYLIPGILLLALLVDAARRSSPSLRGAVAVLLLLPALYGVLSFGANWRRHMAGLESRSVRVRIAQLALPPSVVRYLGTLDRELLSPGSLVVVPMPSLALEFSRTRVLATSVTSMEPAELAGHLRPGRVENLVVIVERAGQGPAAVDAWLRGFTSYDPERWHAFEADGFAFYVPEGQAVDPAWLESAFERSRS